MQPLCTSNWYINFTFAAVERTINSHNFDSILRSCTGRDKVGPMEVADLSWLTTFSANPLNVGQYVNNHTKGSCAFNGLVDFHDRVAPHHSVS